MTYEQVEESLKAVHSLLEEHKLSVKSEAKDSLAYCVQIEGRISERLRILSEGVLRLER